MSPFDVSAKRGAPSREHLRCFHDGLVRYPYLQTRQRRALVGAHALDDGSTLVGERDQRRAFVGRIVASDHQLAFEKAVDLLLNVLAGYSAYAGHVGHRCGARRQDELQNPPHWPRDGELAMAGEGFGPLLEGMKKEPGLIQQRFGSHMVIILS